jgi:translation initiation factor 1
MTLKHIFKGTKWDVPCERCAKPLSECQCPPPPPPPAPGAPKAAPSEQKVLVRIEKRQKGKKVTVLSGLAAKDQEELLPQLKSLCGAGGTIKDGKVEVQGEHKEKIVTELVKRGYAARAG